MPTALIIEDNKTNSNVLARRLAKRGFSCRISENGREGVEEAFTSPPDIILMDIGMPEMDGFEATRLLKADPRTAHIPIVAITASAFTQDREQAEAAGVDGFETKPINFDNLLQQLYALLGIEKKPEGGAAPGEQNPEP